MIQFEVSALDPCKGELNALDHYDVWFSELVNADWLIFTIRAALLAEEKKAEATAIEDSIARQRMLNEKKTEKKGRNVRTRTEKPTYRFH